MGQKKNPSSSPGWMHSSFLSKVLENIVKHWKKTEKKNPMMCIVALMWYRCVPLHWIVRLHCVNSDFQNGWDVQTWQRDGGEGQASAAGVWWPSGTPPAAVSDPGLVRDQRSGQVSYLWSCGNNVHRDVKPFHGQTFGGGGGMLY